MSILPLDSFIKRIPNKPPCYILRVLSPFKEGLMLILNKLFRKQVKSFHLLLDQDPFIFLCSLHNIKYIKFTSLQDISIKVMQLSHSLFPSQVILFRVEFICIFSSLSKTGPSLIKTVPNSDQLSNSESPGFSEFFI